MESKEAGRPPNGGASCSNGSGNSVQVIKGNRHSAPAIDRNGNSAPTTKGNGCAAAPQSNRKVDRWALLTSHPNGSLAPETNGKYVYSQLVTTVANSLAPETNRDVDSQPVTSRSGNSLPETNGNSNSARGPKGNLAKATKGSCTLALGDRLQAVHSEPSSEPTSPWIPKALSFRPYDHPSSPEAPENANSSTGRGAPEQTLKDNGDFQVEESEESENYKHCRPSVVKLTKDLRELYKICNLFPKRTLTKISEGVSNFGRDNVDNDLILRVGDVLENSESKVRYVVLDMLGKGSYGQVCKCWTGISIFREGDVALFREAHVAIKVIKSTEDSCESAVREMSFCKLLNERDVEDKANIVRFIERFNFAGHVCLVFELLSINLRDFSSLHSNRGLSIKAVRRFTLQILDALTALDRAGVMHRDIKPENIVLDPAPLKEFTVLVVERLKALREAGGTPPTVLTQRKIVLHPFFLENLVRIKLIDFGLACSSEATLTGGGQHTYVQSRHYRAPEVVLKQLPYTPAIDMWSVGCVAAELYLGVPLFMGANEYDLFRFMIDILGQPPDDIISRSDDEIISRFFKRAGSSAPSSSASSSDMASDGPTRPRYIFLSEAEVEARAKAYGFVGKPPASKRNFGSSSLHDVIMDKTVWMDITMTEDQMKEEINARAAFLNFLMGTLHFDHTKRLTPRQALQHPFLTGEPWLVPYTPPRLE
ncbi:unnamed protein product [Calypogeia fissa]